MTKKELEKQLYGFLIDNNVNSVLAALFAKQL